MTTRAAFRQGDVTRAIRGVEAAGLLVSAVEVNDNGIVVIVGEPTRKKRHNPVDDLYGPEA